MKFAPKKHAAAPDSGADTASTSVSSETLDPTSAPKDPVSDEKSSDTATEAPKKRLARPSRSALISVSAVAIAFFSGRYIAPADNATLTAGGPTKEEVSLESTKSLVELVKESLSGAKNYRAANGTYVGFTIDGVKIAASDSVILIAASDASSCYFSKIADEVVYEVGSDPTLETCSDAVIASAQEMLNNVASANAQASAVATSAAVSAAAEAAVLYASMSFDASGRPSLYGLTDVVVPNSKVISIAKDGQRAKVQIFVEGRCVSFNVTATPSGAPKFSEC